MTLPPLVHAGVLEDGHAAFEQGDYQIALGLWRPLADQGDADAQYHLGIMYASGRGVIRDHGTAVIWYRKAANQGHKRAQSHLAVAYAMGQGIGRDLDEYIKWSRLSARQGYAVAQYNLGMAYLEGKGVDPDPVEAYAWLSLAAAQCHGEAIAALSRVKDTMTPNQIEKAQVLARECAASEKD